ncbi:hypothetical protein NLJ89_g5644 [Agrocybe chaxingu]|uniref:CBM1 domain-containing protein n=1 Tax=Agrocybe chaxingu TaxID=84603 RepID=A0A9W8K6Z2_9AGAR|nr:hypothetical protein NLJ89_g5644 [Agrocybe chaxingu]
MAKAIMKLAVVSSLAGVALGQAGAWGQCGGNGWTGATTLCFGDTPVDDGPADSTNARQSFHYGAKRYEATHWTTDARVGMELHPRSDFT